MVRRGREAASTVNPADIRRLPRWLGSAARIGFVGSWLILGSGIPLLTTAGPHNYVESARTSSLDATRRTTTMFMLHSSCLVFDWHNFLHHSPQESDELASDRDGSDLGSFPIR